MLLLESELKNFGGFKLNIKETTTLEFRGQDMVVNTWQITLGLNTLNKDHMNAIFNNKKR